MTRRDLLKSGAAALVSAPVAATAAKVAPASLGAQAFHDQRRSVETTFGRISYVEEGRGEAALFLHGWPLNGYHWRGSLAALSGMRRCIAPDFMGLGYSDVTMDQDLSPAAQAAMLSAFMDALGLPGVDLVANDSGTGVAQLLAVRDPRVRSMLLTNGDVHTNCPPEALMPAIEAARHGELVGMFEAHLADPSFAASSMGLGTICYTDPQKLTAEAMEIYFRPLLVSERRRAQCQAYGVAFEPNPLPSIEPALKELRIPVRMLWGTGDVHFQPEWAEWLDRTLPNSRGVRLVERAKLFFTEERPDLVAQEAAALWA